MFWNLRKRYQQKGDDSEAIPVPDRWSTGFVLRDFYAVRRGLIFAASFMAATA